MIPLNEGHLRKILASWMVHYNGGRPHSSLGPGIPDPSLATYQSNHAGIAFRSVTKSLPERFWVDCTTNTDCRGWQRNTPVERDG
jgi:hypothetical protein